jgi:AraC-like DNA-binding protein
VTFASSSSSSVRLNQLTRTLISRSNNIWLFQVSWCRFAQLLTADRADCPHKHSLYELQVVTKGGLNVNINAATSRTLQTGQFLLIPPQTMHSVVFSTPTSSKLVIGFSIEEPNSAIKKALANNKCVVYEISPSIRHIINALRPKLAEANELTPYTLSFLLQGLILEVLNIISPALLCNSGGSQQMLRDKRLEHANSLIASNILYPISGHEIAQELGITVRHLNRIYCAAYGYPVSKQIQKMRIAYAQKLLNTTNLSLNDIAESMSYSSVYSFIRAFTNITGISPGKYRSGTIRNEALSTNAPFGDMYSNGSAEQ